MLGTTQADQKVARVLSDWKPKDGTNHPCLRVLEEPSLSRAQKLQGICFASTLVFSDTPLNRDEAVAQVLTATLVMHYPDMLMLSDMRSSVRVAMTAPSIGEAEVLAWSVEIRKVFSPSLAHIEPPGSNAQYAELAHLLKKQS
ncbi:LOW QUALITY PROTEIN: hypothetical protein PHMEG_00014644 [Phytophthora megakarya]|uniref:Uncharacterized protein n=1 Tax=Phytophthora megakarya TaxID=4795 RepID=A0A225W5C2_9STRA|nr:LOW QUALITY PROTEIN: hypothetical protein PHMEG_00014644 [Phytophthora megakarya]